MLDKFLREFRDFSELNRGLAPDTVTKYVYVVKDCLRSCLQVEDPRNVSTSDILRYSGIYLHQKGIAPRTRGYHIAALKVFFEWLSHTYDVKNPAAAAPYPKFNQKLPIYMEHRHAEKLILSQDLSTFLGLRNTVMLMFFCMGIRVSACCHLNESDLIFERDERGMENLSVKLRASRGKGNRDFIVPMPPEVWIMVRAYLTHPERMAMPIDIPGNDRVLFPSTKRGSTPVENWYGENRRIARENARVMMVNAGKRLGIPINQLHPHAMRHLFGYNLSKAGIDTTTRMKLMAHTSPDSSAIYDHLNMTMARDAVERANPFKDIRTPADELLRAVRKPRA